MGNTAIELRPSGRASAARVRRHVARVRAGCAYALANARQRGHVGRTVNVAATADLLVGIAQDAFVLARSGLGGAAIQRFLDSALRRVRHPSRELASTSTGSSS